MDVPSPYRVLSLDGGGVRGLYSATLLNRLAERLHRFAGRTPAPQLDIGAAFDLIVGTSTGAILAASLTKGVGLPRVIDMYRTQAAAIFQSPMPLQRGCLRDRWKAWLWTLRQLWSPANSTEPLRKALLGVLQDVTLEQVYQKRGIALCIPSIDAETQKAWIFKTPHAPRLTRDNQYKLVDVCMASAAAPIFFPLHAITSPAPGANIAHLFVDGGLYANNPVLVALIEALEMAAPDRPIQVLSVGTGNASAAKVLSAAKDTQRGIWGWKGGGDIVTMSLESQARATTYIAGQLVKAMNHRRVTLHRLIDPPVSSDEAAHMTLDAADARSLSVLETLGDRATDLNYSALTNQVPTVESQMVIDMFSSLKPLPPEDA